MIEFSVSGVETYWWLPIVVAFCISSLTSTAGITGAFLLLPFQVSILGFAGPAVSATNLLYNIVAIPGGIYKYIRDRRVIWPLTGITTLSLMPGFVLGAIIRVKYLPDPRMFKVFIALVLLYLSIRLLADMLRKTASEKHGGNDNGEFYWSDCKFGQGTFSYNLYGTEYQISIVGIITVCSLVGIVSGIYGIGGGALVAPFYVAVFRQHVRAISGVALFSTFVVSVFGVFVYAALEWFYKETGLVISPDWALGSLFGIGGMAGIYFGAVIQKFLPVIYIKIILMICMGIIVVRYMMGFLHF
ncbi:MAG: sulfite exporter TauE/SafE family protein [Calditrichaeota bacterium]|nr:sulfite exporter TauE/SafE family protein [Calditrichota bacterium]MBT7615652.1 sulfite exporter TauE/SafE family protein [Calditrichota bacterium]MBT7787400.1 sulfite exporter TauE/SafE family protein [Calditrichota bacterium]